MVTVDSHFSYFQPAKKKLGDNHSSQSLGDNIKCYDTFHSMSKTSS